VSLARAVSKITMVNVVIMAAGLLTAPIIGRALGPSGRGQLAAIVAPITMIPPALGLGLGIFAAREVAAGRSVRDVLGALLPISVLLGLMGAAGGWFLADALSDGHSTVRTFLRIGFLLAPVSLVAGVLHAVLAGQQRWDRLLVARALPTGVAVVAIPVLYGLDALTVPTAAVVTIVGGLTTVIPCLYMMRRASMFRSERSYTRSALSFGLRAWSGGLANTANLRLDQVLMISLTTDNQLGLYAVAVTIATAPMVLPMAVVGPLQARVAAGERDIVMRITRTTMMLVLLSHVVAGALAVPVISILFGSAFSGAVLMIWLLLGAGLPFAAGMLLSNVLAADGVPGRTAVGQFVALGVSVPLLLVLVPSHGGVGAAVASAAGYSTSLYVLARSTIQRGLASGLLELVIPQREDLAWLRETAQAGFTQLRARTVV
jgi:O-antigen/teichoic acid export membrane protein